jgi:hypothetical protein
VLAKGDAVATRLRGLRRLRRYPTLSGDVVDRGQEGAQERASFRRRSSLRETTQGGARRRARDRL